MRYVGRFAPSPTGALHLGSLYTAAASFLDARANDGIWRIRIDDIDRARNVPGAAAQMLACLEALGFEWDGPVVYESQRLERYSFALAQLRAANLVYRCICSRRDLRDELRYPGTCRRSLVDWHVAGATRLRTQCEPIVIPDLIQGVFAQEGAGTGDFLVERRDGIPAYALCVAVDDAEDGITRVVRGADLLEHTPRQVLLQRYLGLQTPEYAHVPVLTEPDGEKLAKSRRSVAAVINEPGTILYSIFERLGLHPHADLCGESALSLWAWARDRWSIEAVPRCSTLALNH